MESIISITMDSNFEVIDSDTDSDNKTVIKFIKINAKKKPEFDTVAYSVDRTIKIGKLRTELARVDECFNSLQCDYDNLKIDFDLQQETINLQKMKIENKNKIISILFYCFSSLIMYNTVNNLRN